MHAVSKRKFNPSHSVLMGNCDELVGAHLDFTRLQKIRLTTVEAKQAWCGMNVQRLSKWSVDGVGDGQFAVSTSSDDFTHEMHAREPHCLLDQARP